MLNINQIANAQENEHGRKVQWTFSAICESAITDLSNYKGLNLNDYWSCSWVMWWCIFWEEVRDTYEMEVYINS